MFTRAWYFSQDCPLIPMSLCPAPAPLLSGLFVGHAGYIRYMVSRLWNRLSLKSPFGKFQICSSRRYWDILCPPPPPPPPWLELISVRRVAWASWGLEAHLEFEESQQWLISPSRGQSAEEPRHSKSRSCPLCLLRREKDQIDEQGWWQMSVSANFISGANRPKREGLAFSYFTPQKAFPRPRRRFLLRLEWFGLEYTCRFAGYNLQVAL